MTKETGFGLYLDDEVDPETVESHTTVERDEETGDLVRTQMVRKWYKLRRFEWHREITFQDFS